MRRTLGWGVPEVHHGQAVFTEQAGDVVAPVGRDQRVVRLAANAFEGVHAGAGGVGAIGNADRIGIEQAVGEAALGQVYQADDARALPVAVGGGQVG